MVRNYKKKKDDPIWSADDLKQAILEVCGGKTCIEVAAARGIPRETLRRHVQKYKNHEPNNEVGSPTVFTKEQEESLVQLILDYEVQLLGFSPLEIRKIAYEWAVQLGIDHPFNNDLAMAGKDWLHGFMKRSKKLSLRKPEQTSSARALGFNKASVNQFYDLLENIIVEKKIVAANLYNVDETPVCTVPKESSKVIAARGRRQVGAVVSQEREERMTAEICFSATGKYMPPMIIIPRKNENKEFMKGAPAGSIIKFHKSGYMQSEIFLEWLQAFIEFSKPIEENEVLLILDGHSSHTKNLAAINLARENHVTILVLPPHCTHRLQPVDVSFNKPLSTYFEEECKKWMRNSRKQVEGTKMKPKVLTLKTIFEVFTPAYIKAATESNAIGGFRSSGIYPFNRNIFSDDDFAAAARFDIDGFSEIERSHVLHTPYSVEYSEDTSSADTPNLLTNGIDQQQAEPLRNGIDESNLLARQASGRNNSLQISPSTNESLSRVVSNLFENSSAPMPDNYEENYQNNIEIQTSSGNYTEDLIPISQELLVTPSDNILDSIPSSQQDQRCKDKYIEKPASLPTVRKRSRLGRTDIITNENYVDELSVAKKKAEKKKPAGKKKKIADITNQQMTAVQVQVCTPFGPYYQQPPFINSSTPPANRNINPYLFPAALPQVVPSNLYQLPSTPYLHILNKPVNQELPSTSYLPILDKPVNKKVAPKITTLDFSKKN